MFLYQGLASSLREEDKQFLVEKVHTIQILLQERGGKRIYSVEQEIQRGMLTEKIMPYYDYFSRILEPGGTVLIETSGMAGIIPATAFPMPATETEYSNLADNCFRWNTVDGQPYLLLTAQLINKTGQSQVVQVALDVSRENELLKDYQRQLAMILPLGILLSALFGALVARQGMQPLKNITLTVQRITANQLQERIDPTLWPRELQALAEAFNQMLGRLRSSFVQLTQFSADLAHELRTPINNLMGETEVTLARARSEVEYRDVLESSLEECSRLSFMIDSLLFLARTENVKVPLQLVWVDVYQELAVICDSYEAVTEEQGVTVEYEGESSLEVDPILFRRAITNVLANAIRHTSAGGKIKLVVELSPNVHSVNIRVSDNGCGIAHEHLSKVFDRFYRVDQARSTESHNTGLGLAIVESILVLHGGTVSIDSQLGKGTTVTLNFPSGR